MIFPTVSGENLARRTFTLPDDFEKEKNLLIIAFQRQQQFDVASWLPMVHRLQEAHKDLAYYELPALTTFNPLLRWRINAGMRAGIPDHTARETTITLYLDKEAFRAALELPNEEQIYVMLVTHTGEVLWRIGGTWTQKKEDALIAYLERDIETSFRRG